MPVLSSELLVLAAIVAAVLFFSNAMRRLARDEREARAAGMRQAPGEPAEEMLDDYRWGSASAVPEEVARARAMHAEPQVAVPIVGASPTVDAERLRRRLRSPEGLREAVVLLTVLGPCRALEPYDPNTRKRP